MVAINDVREIMVKKPFKRILPNGYMSNPIYYSEELTNVPEDKPAYRIVTQADFMREYYPSGHLINDPMWFPDISHIDPETKKEYVEEVDRCAFAFQKIISTKQLVHLCGNNIQFEMTIPDATKDDYDTFFSFKKGWVTKNMEIAWYESAKSVKLTGDAAFVGYKKNGKFYWKVLSYLNGDVLYPHYDSITGDLSLFARSYSDYDEDGKAITDWLEVWDENYLYRFKKGNSGIDPIITKIKELFGASGYKLVSTERHYFPFIPVSYHRSDQGACWSDSQDTIEEYEISFSRLCQNNSAYAFPIMYLKGEDVKIRGDVYKGTIKAITMGSDDDAGFLNNHDASGSFSIQLNTLYKMIYEQSFAVIPPDVKSGDLPGVAIKLLFSPAYENAMKDAQEFNPFIDKVIKIFEEGFGTEEGITKVKSIKVNGWIKPYIHLNMSELVVNLATAVDRGFLSKHTASEIIDEYSNSDEWNRIMTEHKEQQQSDLLYDLKSKTDTVNAYANN